MQDLAQFELIRSPRRPDLTDLQKLELTGELILTLKQLFVKGDTLDNQEVQNALTLWEGANYNPLDYALSIKPSSGAPAQDGAVLVGELETWLAQNHDRIAGSDVEQKINDLESSYPTTGVNWTAALQQFSVLLASWLADWVAKKKTTQVRQGTRFALVAALASLDGSSSDSSPAIARARRAVTNGGSNAAALATATGGSNPSRPPANARSSSGTSPGSVLDGFTSDDVWDALNRRVVVFPEALAAILPGARVKLVRDATVSDLQVVRSEWRGYVAGEIAMTRNVMAGETFELTEKQLSETEILQSVETQTTTTTQTSVQETQQSDMSHQVSDQLAASIQGYAKTQYEQIGTGNKFTIDAGVSGGVQIGRSETVATKLSREAITRAVQTVESQTREFRSQRQLVRTEETTDHKFEGGSSNLRGVYRWLDRIDRFQVFTYPNRLQLEFELPEPGEYVRWRTAALVQAARVEAPPAWDVTSSGITPQTAMALAVKYRASNLPVMPDPSVSVVKSITAKPDDLPTNPASSQWTPTIIAQDVEIAIPSGYVATAVTYSGFATPLRAAWHREYTGLGKKGGEDLDAFHTIVGNVMVGTNNALYSQPNPLGGANSIQAPDGAPGVEQIQYGDAMLGIQTPNDLAVQVQLSPGATGTIKLGVHMVGAASVTVTFTVTCTRTPQSEEAWRNAVYDALFGAWSDWRRAYLSDQQNQALTGTPPIGESSPDRNEQTVRDELKRQVVAWLLYESPFLGRNGLLPPSGTPPGWREIDFNAVLGSAPTIQFLEQTLEWSNIAYIFYPYYWAGRGDWDSLNGLQANDPVYERFLKAGSARVVVPVRPGMEAAMHHWLLYQEPFLGQPMPIPGTPLYVSVATEIRDMMLPPEDGIPNESWEARIGTTFLWLDDSGAPLPTNPIERLGQPPNEPKDILYPPAQP